MASATAVGTSYATWGEPMIPFYIFYSMFGFQRVGDLIWSFGDQRGRGFLLGATAGRTTLSGEGLQHCDGQSQVLASTVPNCRAYDPAFAYEMAVIVRDGIKRHSDLDHSMMPCERTRRRKVDPGAAFPYESILDRVFQSE